jgi:hypothetical protein
LQTLAVYDQFGRLKLGSDKAPIENVIDYPVFERQVSSPFGVFVVYILLINAFYGFNLLFYININIVIQVNGVYMHSFYHPHYQNDISR